MQEKRTYHQSQMATAHLAQEEKVSFLAGTPLFQDLRADELQTITHLFNIIFSTQGHILYHPGEQCNALFLLKSGTFQIYHLSADGRKLITQIIQPGDCFGAIPLPDEASSNQRHTAFAEATSDSELYSISREDMQHIIEIQPRVTSALLLTLQQRLLAIEEQLTATTFQSVTARLAALLLQLARPQPASPTRPATAKNSTQVVQGLSHADLADRLGVYRETVSSALRELKDVGVIEPGRKRITIRQPARLQDLAENGSKTRIKKEVS